MRYLSLCLIVKDENSYLPEWVTYHGLVGAEHFYIYDNGSRIPVAETLRPEIERGIATVISWPGQAVQTKAYNQCLSDFGRGSRWMAFIDMDEFIVSAGDLREVLSHYERFGGLALSWRVFGSSGRRSRPPGLQMEGFIRRAADDYWINRHIKWIVRPDRTSRMCHPHNAEFKNGFFGVNENGTRTQEPMADGTQSAHTSRIAWINHYYFRSREEWDEKLKRGSAFNADQNCDKCKNGWLERHDPNCNNVQDTSILRFGPRVAEALRKRAKT